MGPIGWPELLIILVVVLLLFGTTRLAGLGKASGKAIREFKEETRSLKDKASADQATEPQQQATAQQGYTAPQPQGQPYTPQQLPNGQQPYQAAQEVYEAEVVDPNDPRR